MGPVIPGDSNHLSVGVCSARLCLGSLVSECVLGMGRGKFLSFLLWKDRFGETQREWS